MSCIRPPRHCPCSRFSGVTKSGVQLQGGSIRNQAAPENTKLERSTQDDMSLAMNSCQDMSSAHIIIFCTRTHEEKEGERERRLVKATKGLLSFQNNGNSDYLTCRTLQCNVFNFILLCTCLRGKECRSRGGTATSTHLDPPTGCSPGAKYTPLSPSAAGPAAHVPLFCVALLCMHSRGLGANLPS